MELNGHGPKPSHYRPSANLKSKELQFREFVERKHRVKLANYRELHRWSCDNYAEFWEAVVKFAEIKFHDDYDQVIDKSQTIADFPKWFEGATLNYTENVIERGFKENIAIIDEKNNGVSTSYTYEQLREDVYRVATSLRNFGIGKEDTVCGFLPNNYETAVAMFATAAVGASWCSASVDFGPAGVLDRFKQVNPKILFTVNSVTYKRKHHDLSPKLNEIVAGLPSLEKVVVMTKFTNEPLNLENYKEASKFQAVDDFKVPFDKVPEKFEYTMVPFSQPLFVMFSSGTTGIPKAMVHTVGGTLLKHVEEHILQGDSRSYDRMFFYTTCGWMMWNWMVSFLYCGGSLVLYDESPLEPDNHILMKIISRNKATMIGMGAKLYDEFVKMNYRFCDSYSLAQVRTVYSTGSPLKHETFDFINTHINPAALIASISGGTDIIGCFMGGVHSLPVNSGECQCFFLGMDIAAYDEEGKPVENEQGELVCLKPFPSMPSHFLGDKDRSKYKKAYFEKYDGIWAHGDYCKINSRTGGVVMLGRSDATLNRGGVRIGTAEIYAVVETFLEVSDSIVAGKTVDEGSDELVILFLKMNAGYELNDELRKKICTRIRNEMSPRHVPNKILEVEQVPYTNSGKKVEIAVKQIINGETPKKASSLRNPDSLDCYEQFKSLN
ncbi:unnamed protein product [Caenorhabditis auriculariae]|uniref:Acetoacetyl-CoA synthetase n=1 Tax=Caenorhabditis auriculariae TaxID=2777116 RepID=A0A8S1HAD2_9PELO|nr:unnamed protein product [Caenorhabditis auriculariae]